MEKQGIITGVGNEITPEIDAVLNDFIVGKNTIISGLDWNGNTLNAGVCQLCGYRGVLEQPINNLTDDYVYGKFELHFDKNIEDKFSIETSASRIANDNPTSITIEGTYYLLLYYKKKGFDEYNYPNMAHTSLMSAILAENGIIESTATASMPKTAEGNLKVNMHKTDPQMVANTEYVHKQIQEELNEGTEEIYVNIDDASSNLIENGNIEGTIIFHHRAKYVYADGSLSVTGTGVLIEFGTQTVGKLNKYIPDNVITGCFVNTNGAVNLLLKIDTNGNVVLSGSAGIGTTLTPNIGYECK